MTKKLFKCGLALLAAGLATARVSASTAIPQITVDENGNGIIASTPGFNGTFTGGLSADPSGGVPAASGNVLVYTLPSAWPVFSGDVQMSNPDGSPSDLIRFYSSNGANYLIFYSLLGDEGPPNVSDGLADISAKLFNAIPLQANVARVAEVNGSGVYTPVLGSGPGYVGGGAIGVNGETYTFISDVPEPSSLLMFGAMLAGALVLRIRR